MILGSNTFSSHSSLMVIMSPGVVSVSVIQCDTNFMLDCREEGPGVEVHSFHRLSPPALVLTADCPHERWGLVLISAATPQLDLSSGGIIYLPERSNVCM